MLNLPHCFWLELRGTVTLSTAQIGKCGEMLVQYRLLLLAIESAPMSTDTGIDLVLYSPECASATTVQVKTNLRPKPGAYLDPSSWHRVTRR
jgi:hypothetical protein